MKFNIKKTLKTLYIKLGPPLTVHNIPKIYKNIQVRNYGKRIDKKSL